MSQQNAKKSQFQNITAQSSAFLLGLGLPASLTLSGYVCQSNALSGFGWALLAALTGCLATTLMSWSKLLNTLVPEQATWIKSTVAGLFVAVALVLQGLALGSSGWSPIDTIALAFIPWSRTMWRLVAGTEVFSHAKSRLPALVFTICAVLYLSPEFLKIGSFAIQSGAPFPFNLGLPPTELTLPRNFSFLSALCFGAASSLQVAQERSISSVIFWSIPIAISAITLGFVGWVALQHSGIRSNVMGNMALLPTQRLMIAAPAFIFGIVMFALRPRIQINNALLIGRETNSWWQSLGLSGGCAVTLLFWQSAQLRSIDIALFALLILGQFLSLRLSNEAVAFAPKLSLVVESDIPSEQQSRFQNS